METEVCRALEDGYTTFISGFADGADLLFAEIVAQYMQQNPHIFLEAAIPYPNRINNANARLRGILARCSGMRIVSDNYHTQCFAKRNRYMVQQSNRVIAVYDGRESGGTLFTMRYTHCLERDVRVINIGK